MIKTKSIIVIVLIGVTLLLGVRYYLLQKYFYHPSNDNLYYHIVIQNGTNIEVYNLQIIYGDATELIPSIPAKKSIKIKIDTMKASPLSGPMWVVSIDKSGNIEKTIIADYFRRGAGGTAKVNIISADSNGKLEIKVVQDSL